MADLKNNIFNNNIAGDTSNILVPDTSAIKNGIEFKSNINSNVLNGYYNLLSEAIQFLQFTGGLYSEEADYDEGNIASLVIKNGEDYSIWQFRRNANNPQVLNNNPPLTGASITTVNGVDAYEGGSLNTDWDKLTEDYAVEATPNTVMGRDGEGASNVNMPSSIEDTTVVNNQYLQQELQTGLAAKQDKLTAGTNITIEDNVISASGDLATRADLVTYDNSNTDLEKLLGYDYPKFKVPIADTNTIVVEYLPDEPRNTSINKVGNDYFWQREMTQVQFLNGSNRDEIKINLINNITITNNYWYAINFFFQFFSFSKLDGTEFIDLDEDEMQVEMYTGGSSNKCSISFEVNARDGNFLLIIKTDQPNLSGGGNVTINIKNRVLRPADRNIFGITSNGDTFALNLQQTSGAVKLVGTVQGYTAAENGLQFYSEIIENYFNMGSVGTFTNTTEITSSTGKAVKYSIYKAGSGVYALNLAYQDGSSVQQGDVFTFNLAPSKNSTLNPIYQNVTNVQQLGEVLSQKDTELLNKINGLKAANIKIDTISGLNASNVQQAAAALNQKIYNIYDTSRKVPINDYALINNEKYNFYRVFCVKEVELIEDGKEHMLAVKYDTVNRANIVCHSITLVGGQKTICFSGSCSAANGFDFRVNIYSGELQLYYTIYSAQSFNKIIFFIDYY